MTVEDARYLFCYLLPLHIPKFQNKMCLLVQLLDKMLSSEFRIQINKYEIWTVVRSKGALGTPVK